MTKLREEFLFDELRRIFKIHFSLTDEIVLVRFLLFGAEFHIKLAQHFCIDLNFQKKS